MVDGIPQTNGGINPAHSKVLDDLKTKIDGKNQNGLKGSEIINFVNFAKAEGVSDEDIQAYMEKNGLAIIKDSDENRKVDIKEFKAEEKFKSSRKTKNEILDLRQRYMNVALEAFKNADSPEQKARIMDLVQKMPRTDESYSNFCTRIEGWETKLGLIIGFDNVQKSLDAVNEKMDAQHAEALKKMDDNTTYTVNETKQAIEESEGRLTEHMDEVGAKVTTDVNKFTSQVGKNVVRQVGAKIDDAVTQINDHTDEQGVGLRHSLIGKYGEVDDDGNHITEVGGALGAATKDVKETVGDAAKDVKKVVKEEHQETRRQNAQTAHNTQALQSARAEVTESLKNLDKNHVKALGIEAEYIMRCSLDTNKKVQLLESMAQYINDEGYISNNDISKIVKARQLMLNGKNLPTKDVNVKGYSEPIKDYFIDYDKIE